MMNWYKFVVITGANDHGNWTGHAMKKDAIACAKQVQGTCYRVKGDSYHKMKLKEVKLK